MPAGERTPIIRVTAMPTDTNPYGGVFGGWLMGADQRGNYPRGTDPIVLTAAAVLLTLVAFGAGLLPAQKAARIDPMIALRYE